MAVSKELISQETQKRVWENITVTDYTDLWARITQQMYMTAIWWFVTLAGATHFKTKQHGYLEKIFRKKQVLKNHSTVFKATRGAFMSIVHVRDPTDNILRSD